MINVYTSNNEKLISILSDISDSLSKNEPLFIKLLELFVFPIIIAIITTIVTIKLTNKREKEREKKIEYISCIKLFKDIHQSITFLKDDIYSNITFLTFLKEYSEKIENLYISLKLIKENQQHQTLGVEYIAKNATILQKHNDYLKTILITENKLTIYENEYSNLLYDVADLLKTEEINAVIQHYNNVIFLNKIKTNITRSGIEPEEAKFYLLDILKVYEGNEYSIINDQHLKSCYELLYIKSGYNKIEGFEKIKFEKIID